MVKAHSNTCGPLLLSCLGPIIIILPGAHYYYLAWGLESIIIILPGAHKDQELPLNVMEIQLYMCCNSAIGMGKHLQHFWLYSS